MIGRHALFRLLILDKYVGERQADESDVVCYNCRVCFVGFVVE